MAHADHLYARPSSAHAEDGRAAADAAGDAVPRARRPRLLRRLPPRARSGVRSVQMKGQWRFVPFAERAEPRSTAGMRSRSERSHALDPEGVSELDKSRRA